MAKRFSLRSEGTHPFGALIGLNFSEWGEGFSRCILDVRPELLNPHGVVHGAVMYGMADTGMGAALYSRLEEKELCATVEIKIVYLAAVTAGRLSCLTRLVHKGKRIAILESEVESEGRLVAKALGTYSIFTPKEIEQPPSKKKCC